LISNVPQNHLRETVDNANDLTVFGGIRQANQSKAGFLPKSKKA